MRNKINLEYNNYTYEVDGNRVIAKSTFAKKEVKGVAICAPEDEFDLEYGKKLAAARCNLEVALKREKAAKHSYMVAERMLIAASANATHAVDYYRDALDASIVAIDKLKKVAAESAE